MVGKRDIAAGLVDMALGCAGGAVGSGPMEPLLSALAGAVDADCAACYGTMARGELRQSGRYGAFHSAGDVLQSSQWVELLGDAPLYRYRIRCFKGTEYPWLLSSRAPAETALMAVFFMRERGGIGLILLGRYGGHYFGADEQAVAEQAARLLSARWGDRGMAQTMKTVRIDEPAVSLDDLPLAAVGDQIQKRGRMDTLGELAGKLSHEIRNPLGAIRNALYCLSAKSGDAGESRYVRIIEKEIERCTAVIDSLLDFTERLEPALEMADINTVVDEVLTSMTVPAGVRVEMSCDPQLPLIKLDKRLMVRAVGNLIVNALESLPGGGMLRLATRSDEALVEVIIEDSGTGIRPDQFDRIFDPFFTTKGKGLGLGLMSSLNIVQAHGGTITASSLPGRGSVFTVKLSRHEG